MLLKKHTSSRGFVVNWPKWMQGNKLLKIWHLSEHRPWTQRTTSARPWLGKNCEIQHIHSRGHTHRHFLLLFTDWRLTSVNSSSSKGIFNTTDQKLCSAKIVCNGVCHDGRMRSFIILRQTCARSNFRHLYSQSTIQKIYPLFSINLVNLRSPQLQWPLNTRIFNSIQPS